MVVELRAGIAWSPLTPRDPIKKSAATLACGPSGRLHYGNAPMAKLVDATDLKN
jgi:hypothetical protein